MDELTLEVHLPPSLTSTTASTLDSSDTVFAMERLLKNVSSVEADANQTGSASLSPSGYEAPEWVYLSAGISLSVIGALGIGSNLTALVVYIADGSVRV